MRTPASTRTTCAASCAPSFLPHEQTLFVAALALPRHDSAAAMKAFVGFELAPQTPIPPEAPVALREEYCPITKRADVSMYAVHVASDEDAAAQGSVFVFSKGVRGIGAASAAD